MTRNRSYLRRLIIDGMAELETWERRGDRLYAIVTRHDIPRVDRYRVPAGTREARIAEGALR